MYRNARISEVFPCTMLLHLGGVHVYCPYTHVGGAQTPRSMQHRLSELRVVRKYLQPIYRFSTRHPPPCHPRIRILRVFFDRWRRKVHCPPPPTRKRTRDVADNLWIKPLGIIHQPAHCIVKGELNVYNTLDVRNHPDIRKKTAACTT